MLDGTNILLYRVDAKSVVFWSLDAGKEIARLVGWMEAIVRWIEDGKAPAKLMAERRDEGGKIIRTRPLFPYPQVAQYLGKGSIDDAASFVAHTPAW